MPDLAISGLRVRAVQAYERGRLLTAVRITPVVAALAALCARETGEWRRCAIVGVVLLAVSITVRWRLPRGRHVVDAGLLTGAAPMLAALVLCRFALESLAGTALGVCALAGFVSGWLTGRVAGGAAQWPAAALVAGLTAALGCIGIGFGTAVGGTAAVAAGAIVAARLPRHV